MELKQLPRVFVFKNEKGDKESVRLPDPNPQMSTEEVLDHYSTDYPKLVNSVVTESVEVGGVMEYRIENNFGPKG